MEEKCANRKPTILISIYCLHRRGSVISILKMPLPPNCYSISSVLLLSEQPWRVRDSVRTRCCWCSLVFLTLQGTIVLVVFLLTPYVKGIKWAHGKSELFFFVFFIISGAPFSRGLGPYLILNTDTYGTPVGHKSEYFESWNNWEWHCQVQNFLL